MIAKVFSATSIGFDGRLIEVECDTSNGLPNLLIVGLGNKAIDEAKERVRSAIKNTGLDFPRKRITINLAPANIPKHGAHFDLAIAIALLAVSGQLPACSLENTLIVGELALDGFLRPIRGTINYAETAKEHGLENIILPSANAQQAALVSGLSILPANSLRDAYLHLSDQAKLSPIEIRSPQPTVENAPSVILLDDIKGQEQAKRALTIAAAGHHNILLSGPPGAGKTMLAKALTSILPPLTPREIIDVTKLHSLSGEAYDDIITCRPFRSPHHSASHVSLVGGGQIPKPGEISLAHHGVLFLDELPEYSRQALESLRQPLEDHHINIARANERVDYPANFMLVATQNPCPCGYASDSSKTCSCSPFQIMQYQKRLSGPLLDRIDLFIEVSRVEPHSLMGQPPEHSGSDIARAHVVEARRTQQVRYGNSMTNATLSSRDVNLHANLNPDAKALLDKAANAFQLSARSYFKIIKIARTIADIEKEEAITAAHLSEALQYRYKPQTNS